MIRRTLPATFVVGVAVLLPSQVARAQWASPVASASRLERAPVTAATVERATAISHVAAPARAPESSVAAKGGYFSLRRLGTIAGSTALGAGLGYFSSQIRMSDWDSRAQQEEGHALRRRYSVRGAIAGATLGFVVPVGRAPRNAPGTPISRLGAASLLRQEEIAHTVAANAFEAVQSLRPRWLVKQQVLSIADAVGDAGGAAEDRDASGDVSILVYLNAAKMGTIETLRDIPIANVQYIRFYTGSEATYKWGWGHAQGVIQVSTLGMDQAQ